MLKLLRLVSIYNKMLYCKISQSLEPAKFLLVRSLWNLMTCQSYFKAIPDSKVHGVNMGPTWVMSAPGGPHISPVILAIREYDDFNYQSRGFETSRDLKASYRILKLGPVAHSTDDNSIEFESRPKYALLWFKMYSTDHNENLHMPRQCTISLWSVQYIVHKSTSGKVLGVCGEGQVNHIT